MPVDRGPLSNDVLISEMDNEENRIRMSLMATGYYVENVIFRTRGTPSVVIEARAFQKEDDHYHLLNSRPTPGAKFRLAWVPIDEALPPNSIEA
jgi:hypothetical protein